MQVTKTNLVTLIIILLVIVAVGFYTWSITHESQEERLAISPAAQSLITGASESPYTDLEGNTISLADYVGEVLVVSSWASWCPFCKEELTELSKLTEFYQDQSITVLAINRAEPATTAERFLKSIGATQSVTLVLDPDDKFYKSIGGYAMPETIFYDKTGQITHHSHVTMSFDEMRQQVEKASLIEE